jgi:hypothetical protein
MWNAGGTTGWAPLDGMGAPRVQTKGADRPGPMRGPSELGEQHEVISSVHRSFGASRGRVAISAGYPSVQTRGNVTVGPTVEGLTNQGRVWGKSIREGRTGLG